MSTRRKMDMKNYNIKKDSQLPEQEMFQHFDDFFLDLEIDINFKRPPWSQPAHKKYFGSYEMIDPPIRELLKDTEIKPIPFLIPLIVDAPVKYKIELYEDICRGSTKEQAVIDFLRKLKWWWMIRKRKEEMKKLEYEYKQEVYRVFTLFHDDKHKICLKERDRLGKELEELTKRYKLKGLPEKELERRNKVKEALFLLDKIDYLNDVCERFLDFLKDDAEFLRDEFSDRECDLLNKQEKRDRDNYDDNRRELKKLYNNFNKLLGEEIFKDGVQEPKKIPEWKDAIKNRNFIGGQIRRKKKAHDWEDRMERAREEMEDMNRKAQKKKRDYMKLEEDINERRDFFKDKKLKDFREYDKVCRDQFALLKQQYKLIDEIDELAKEMDRKIDACKRDIARYLKEKDPKKEKEQAGKIERQVRDIENMLKRAKDLELKLLENDTKLQDMEQRKKKLEEKMYHEMKERDFQKHLKDFDDYRKFIEEFRKWIALKDRSLEDIKKKLRKDLEDAKRAGKKTNFIKLIQQALKMGDDLDKKLKFIESTLDKLEEEVDLAEETADLILQETNKKKEDRLRDKFKRQMDECERLKRLLERLRREFEDLERMRDNLMDQQDDLFAKELEELQKIMSDKKMFLHDFKKKIMDDLKALQKESGRCKRLHPKDQKYLEEYMKLLDEGVDELKSLQQLANNFAKNLAAANADLDDLDSGSEFDTIQKAKKKVQELDDEQSKLREGFLDNKLLSLDRLKGWVDKELARLRRLRDFLNKRLLSNDAKEFPHYRGILEQHKGVVNTAIDSLETIDNELKDFNSKVEKINDLENRLMNTNNPIERLKLQKEIEQELRALNKVHRGIEEEQEDYNKMELKRRGIGAKQRKIENEIKKIKFDRAMKRLNNHKNFAKDSMEFLEKDMEKLEGEQDNIKGVLEAEKDRKSIQELQKFLQNVGQDLDQNDEICQLLEEYDALIDNTMGLTDNIFKEKNFDKIERMEAEQQQNFSDLDKMRKQIEDRLKKYRNDMARRRKERDFMERRIREFLKFNIRKTIERFLKEKHMELQQMAVMLNDPYLGERDRELVTFKRATFIEQVRAMEHFIEQIQDFEERAFKVVESKKGGNIRKQDYFEIEREFEIAKKKAKDICDEQMERYDELRREFLLQRVQDFEKVSEQKINISSQNAFSSLVWLNYKFPVSSKEPPVGKRKKQVFDKIIEVNFFEQLIKIYVKRKRDFKLEQTIKSTNLFRPVRAFDENLRITLLIANSKDQTFWCRDPIEKEKLYSLLCSIRPNNFTWCPKLCKTNSNRSETTIFNKAITNIFGETREKKAKKTKSAPNANFKGDFKMKIARQPDEEYLMFCGTWNLKGRMPEAKDIRKIIQAGEKFDFYVVGLHNSPWKTANDAGKFLLDGVFKPEGDYFDILVTESIGKTQMIVIITKIYSHKITNLQTSKVALGPQGAIGIGFSYEENEILFINSTFPDIGSTEARQAIYLKITQDLKLRMHDIGIMSQFHAIYWMGTFGYQQMKPTDTDIYKICSRHDVTEIPKILDNHDTFNKDMKKAVFFPEFIEPKITFMPTFPYSPSSRELQRMKGVNACYTDRILYKTNDDMNVDIIQYESSKIGSSPYLFVYGVFKCTVLLPFSVITQAPKIAGIKVTFTTVHFQPKNKALLKKIKKPKVQFIGNFLDDWKTSVPSSYFLEQGTEMIWFDEELPPFVIRYERFVLDRQRIILVVKDQGKKGDRTVASGNFSMKGIVNRLNLNMQFKCNDPFVFKFPAWSGGQVVGTFQGEVEVKY